MWYIDSHDRRNQSCHFDVRGLQPPRPTINTHENILTFKRHRNPSIQTHLVLLYCIKRLCIIGPKSAIQIRLWPNGASYAYSYYGTLIKNPTPGIQWYNFRPLGWPLTGEWAPREALFVKLLWPLVLPVKNHCRNIQITKSGVYSVCLYKFLNNDYSMGTHTKEQLVALQELS